MESWISKLDVQSVDGPSKCLIYTENKESHVRGEEMAKDMAAVQALLTKHVCCMIHTRLCGLLLHNLSLAH